MKTFILLLLCSANAFAGTIINHEYNEVLNGIALNNACITETTVETIRPMKVCTEKREVHVEDQGSSSIDYICLRWNSQSLIYPRKGLPESILIRTWTENGEFNNYPGEQSNFIFPACR